MRPTMRLILGLVALVLILLGVALALPNNVTVARSMVINAPEPVVFPYLNNLHKFNDWSPWAARDEQLRMSYSGPEAGKGAHAEWTSDKRSVGNGSMEITESDPSRHLELTVNFNGMDGTSYYDIAPAGSGSKVTWGFNYDTGTSPFKRWKGLMLDRFIGAEYIAGLTKLKARVEADRAPLMQAPPVAPPPPAPVPGPGSDQPQTAGPGQTTVVPETAPQASTVAPPPEGAPPAPPKPVKKKKRQTTF